MIEQVWQDRWDGLNGYIKQLFENWDNLDKSFPRRDSIFITLQCLQEFGQRQFEFFKKGFSENKLLPSINFPPENAFAATLDQISYDIAVIEKTVEQRKMHDDILKTADYLAYEALKPILPQQGNRNFVMREPTTVLTYFQKSSSVRIIPYSPIVLIGIPFSCINAFEDFLAIPHEVGHYVFRHGRVNIEVLRNLSRSKFEGFDELSVTWFEELFADIYGALIAGPAISLSFQDLQMAKTIEDFYQGDGEHPVPLLRPYIYMHIIHGAKEDRLKNWTAKLSDNWVDYLSKRDEDVVRNIHGKKKDEFLEDAIKNEFINERKFRKKKEAELQSLNEQISTSFSAQVHNQPINISIRALREVLFEEFSVGSWPSTLQAPEEKETAKDLYTKFKTFVENIPAVDKTVPELRLGTESIIFVGNNDEDGSTRRKIGETGLPMEEIRKRLESLPKNETIPAKGKNGWLSVLDAGGWTVKGPDCESTGGVCVG